MIRIDRIWLATDPMDMRAGVDTCLARVITVFGEAQPHQAYIFLNKRANRMKVLVHDGFGLWLAARRLHKGRFAPAQTWETDPLELNDDQWRALVVGLPWRQAGPDMSIRVL